MARKLRVEYPGAINHVMNRGDRREPSFQSWKGMAFEGQSSTDLKQWSPMTTVTNLTGTLEFTDPDVTNDLRRFYRALLQ